MKILDDEFRERLRTLQVMCEQTTELVRQILELEARIAGRVDVLEESVDALENSGE
jgi:uncharacterized protein Yka (UPF0111/DUF47 family)